MNFKSAIVLVFVLFMLCNISAIYADTYIVGNSSFSLPDGYALSEKDDQVLLYNNKYAITLYEGPIISTNNTKNSLINNGYTFIGERDYDVDGIAINQQNYNKNGVNTCVYTFKKNGHTYIISLNLDENRDIPEYEENPVTEIINTLKVAS